MCEKKNICYVDMCHKEELSWCGEGGATGRESSFVFFVYVSAGILIVV